MIGELSMHLEPEELDFGLVVSSYGAYRYNKAMLSYLEKDI